MINNFFEFGIEAARLLKQLGIVNRLANLRGQNQQTRQRATLKGVRFVHAHKQHPAQCFAQHRQKHHPTDGEWASEQRQRWLAVGIVDSNGLTVAQRT